MAGLTLAADPLAALETNLETSVVERNPVGDEQRKAMAAIFQLRLAIPVGAKGLQTTQRYL
jgi:hypothetical protein